MLLSQALERLYSIDNTTLLNELSSQCPTLFNEQLPVASMQILITLISSQEEGGSWGDMCELTAYAILTLSSLARLPWLRDELDQYGVSSCISRGKSYLEVSGRSEWAKGRYIWIEKVTYASPLLSEIYCHAAMHISPARQERSDLPPWCLAKVLPNPTALAAMRKAGALMAHTALLAPSELEPCLLRAAELQATYALGELERHKREVFPTPLRKCDDGGSHNEDTDKAVKDKYLIFVPLTWTACAALYGGKAASLDVLYEMMILSMLVYQADEYMEGVVEQELGTKLELVSGLVSRVIRDQLASPPSPSSREQDDFNNRHGAQYQSTAAEMRPDLALVDTERVLRSFVSHILRHPCVLRSPKHLQARVTCEVEAFLLAHLVQAEDNRALRALQQEEGLASSPHPNGTGHQPCSSAHAWNGPTTGGRLTGTLHHHWARPSITGRTFYSWVRSTSADHTSCPFAFVFFNCLVGYLSPPACPFDLYGCSAKVAYVAEDLCRHLASMCRMYNDYASVVRDSIEGNLNSIEFTDFCLGGKDSEIDGVIDHKRAQLMWTAEYERRGMEAAMLELEDEIGVDNGRGRACVDAMKLFISVTDLYGQVYVLQDITNRVKLGGKRDEMCVE